MPLSCCYSENPRPDVTLRALRRSVNAIPMGVQIASAKSWALVVSEGNVRNKGDKKGIIESRCDAMRKWLTDSSATFTLPGSSSTPIPSFPWLISPLIRVAFFPLPPAVARRRANDGWRHVCQHSSQGRSLSDRLAIETAPSHFRACLVR